MKLAVCLYGPLFLGRSSLPFASPQTIKILCRSFDQALWPQAFVVRALKPAVCLHGPLFLRCSSLPFASPQALKIPCGSFDQCQALWPQAFVVTALKPAVCLHCPLFLGCSSLPFASPQALKIPCSSFDQCQALWPQAFVVTALKPAVCLHGPLLLGRSSLPCQFFFAQDLAFRAKPNLISCLSQRHGAAPVPFLGPKLWLAVYLRIYVILHGICGKNSLCPGELCRGLSGTVCNSGLGLAFVFAHVAIETKDFFWRCFFFEQLVARSLVALYSPCPFQLPGTGVAKAM